MQNPTNASTALIDVLPCWGSKPATILVGDSVQTDGRFVLHTIASHVLSDDNNNNEEQRRRLLWIAGGSPLTPALIASALKKMGCEVAARYLRQAERKNDDALCIRCIASELAERLSGGIMVEPDKQQPPEIDLEVFTKQLYRDIKTWLQDSSSSSTSWVILDDVSTLAALVGSRLTYGLILSLRALACRDKEFGLVIRCAQDAGQAKVLETSGPAWIGAGGGGGDTPNENHDEPEWESALVELVDWVVDVMPLASGYTREAHGRLVLSSTGSASGTTHTRLVYNYCLTDNKALAIQIHGS